jgi:uncharacterized protein
LAYVLISDRYVPKHVLEDISPLPFLVLHGDRDVMVPWHYGREIYEQDKAPKWFWKLPGLGYIQAMSAQHRDYRQAPLDFLDQVVSAIE